MARVVPLDLVSQVLPEMFKGLSQRDMDNSLAKFAQESADDLIRSGRASPQYEVYVNNHRGRVQDVKAPGPVLFLFNNWPIIIETALELLIQKAPRRSGKFQNSFIVVVNGTIANDFKNIPTDAEVIITNAQPYVRKIETGALQGVPPRLFDAVKSRLSSRYSLGFKFSTKFLDLPSGIHPLVPYTLKYSAVNKRGKTRRGRRAGDNISYPSIVIKATE